LYSGLFGLWIGFIYIRKYLFRRREKEFVHRVIAQDEQHIKAAPVDERKYLRELQEKWWESVDLLRGSYLRKQGNPLYVLPWYLILGESGTGKTSAIKNTNLNSPLTEVSRTAGISVTRNCDWWFFEEAIILDTAGRYTIPVNEGVDKKEWEEFLTLLAKYRRKEPINGVIVTIATDKLQEMNEAKLSDEGRSVRRRIDQLIRVLGANFPIYILVTKLDLVQGMVEFSDHLPKSSRDQAMGYINKNLNPDWSKVLDEAMSYVSDNLKELISIIVHQGEQPEPEVFLFTSGVERLRVGLNLFIQAVFERNPYQETPLFRGIFFSSAIQVAKPRAESSLPFGLNSEELQNIVHNNGLFLKELFRKIMPNDRQLFSRIPEFLRWHRLTRNMGLLSWALLWLCLCGFLSFSFINNRSAINVVVKNNYDPPILTQNIAQDLLLLSQMKSKVLELEKVNDRWLIPKIGFRHGQQIETKLKILYLQSFRDEVLYSFDRKLLQEIEAINGETNTDRLLDYYEFLLTRIALLRQRVEGKRTFSMKEFTEKANTLLIRENKELSPQVASIFSTLYHDYLSWNENEKEFEEQLEKYQYILDKFLNEHENLKRIIFESITGASDIRLADFWEERGNVYNDKQIVISGIYTNESQKQIEHFFSILETTIADATIIEDEKEAFWNWYQMQFYNAWGGFSQQFIIDMSELEKDNNIHHIATLMTTDHNPYFLFIERMSEEIAQVPKINEEPSWIRFVQELNEIQKQSKVKEEKGSLLGNIESTKESIIQKTIGKVDKKKALESELLLRLAQTWGEYTQALEQISPALGSTEQCFQMFAEFNQSPLALADSKCNELKNLLQDKGDFPLIWNFVVGPQRFLITYCAQEAACVIQQQWEEQVLGGIKGAKSENIPQILFNKTDGIVWKFLDNTAKPFVTSGSSGYLARKQFESIIPFKGEFFDFLDNGLESVVNYQPVYYVTMETLPLGVNTKAKVAPHGCNLRLQCADEKLILENYNYPQKLTFNWSPETCGDATLSILFSDLTLTKTYKGKYGFAELLSEFRDGSRTFDANEFPEAKEELQNRGISWIRLYYKITGSQTVIELLEKSPSHVPVEIVYCWSR